MIQPPEGILKSPSIGKWCHDAHSAVQEEATKSAKHQTVVQVLHFFCQMNMVFLQDPAAMLALHPEQSCHPIFDLPVFINVGGN